MLTVNWMDKLSDKLSVHIAERIGAMITFPDGTQAVDMDIMAKHNRKCQVALYAVCVGAAIVGAKLGKWQAKK